MSAPKKFKGGIKGCESAQEVLERIALLPAHKRVQKSEPAYAGAFEEWIEENLPPGVKKKRPSTLDKDIADLEREYTQLSLPFPEEDFPHHPIEEKVAALEARWPDGLWRDDESGEVITVSMALRSPELRKRALEIFHGRAAKLKEMAKQANWDLALFADLRACFEEEVRITDDDIRAFYGSGAWASARAVCLDRDGPFCVECGDYSGPFEVDHKVPVRECWHLRLVQSNLQVLCKPDHAAKHHPSGA